MNITGLLLPLAFAPAILKFMKRSPDQKLELSNGTRPERKDKRLCSVGEKPYFDPVLKEWRCIVDF